MVKRFHGKQDIFTDVISRKFMSQLAIFQFFFFAFGTYMHKVNNINKTNVNKNGIQLTSSA